MALSSPARSNRASFTASRRSVFIRSPERFGVIEGATTMHGHPELAQPTRNDESTWACFVADLHARICSVRFTKSRQQLFDSVKIIADGSIEPHFPVSTALSYRDGD